MNDIKKARRSRNIAPTKDTIMAKIALAFSIMPDSPLPTIIEWARAAEDAGFDGVFMTEANNDSLACSLGIGFNTSRVTLGTAITNIYLRHRICWRTRSRPCMN
jgi:alkanesulfonate monooxygenase SsuD/methylene tetrahydromethanopterin reductase-like flavin-dependent oxidoreductase (luciferase family)